MFDMNKKEKVVCFLKKCIVPFSFAVLSLFGCLSCFLLQDFKLDYLSFQMINYNRVLGNGEYDAPILSVAKTDDKIKEDGTPFYNDLFSVFHYNMLVNGARTVSVSDTSLLLNDADSTSFDLSLTTQPTFTIDKDNLATDDNPVFHIASGQHYSYFPEIVNRHRGDSTTSFMFISDTLANKLIETLNVPGESLIERYQNLIVDEQYCFQKLIIDDAHIANVAINNILHTDYSEGQSSRMFKLHGDFALIWADIIKDKLSLSFEIDLKTNPYGNKKTIKNIEALGYTGSNSIFNLRICRSDVYLVDANLSKSLNEALKTGNNVFSYLPFIVIQIACCVFCFIINKKPFISMNKRVISLVLLGMFVTYGLVVTFTYNYPLFTITPLVFIGLWLIFWYWFSPARNKRSNNRNSLGTDYYEIKI